MEDEDTPVTLLKNCRFTVCEKIPSDDNSLNSFLTDKLQFKITGCDPLVIEKPSPSLDDINKLFDRLKTSLHSQRDLIDLEQKKGNVSCEGLMQKSLLLAEEGNRQSTEDLVESNCEDYCSNETSSQVQDSNADVHYLTSSFQSLKMDDDHVQENEFEKSLSRDEIFPELTSVTVVPEKIAETVGSTKNSQVNCESKTQVEKSQKDCLRKRDSVAACDGGTVQNAPIGTENDTKYSNVSQKQDSQDMEHTSKNGGQLNTDNHEVDTQTKLTAQKNNSDETTYTSTDENKQFNEDEKNKNCESVLTEQPCRKSTDHVKGDEDSEYRNEKTGTTHHLTTSGQESPIRQNNVTACSSSAHKMEDALRFKEEGEQSLNRASHLRVKNRDVDKEVIDEDKTKGPKLPLEVACMQKVETGDRQIYPPSSLQVVSGDIILKKETIHAFRDQEHLPLSVQNVCNLPINDLANLENSSRQKNFASTNLQVSTLNENENKSNIFEQPKLEPSQIFHESNKMQDSTDSSDSDPESQHDLTGSIKASWLDASKMYFKEPCYKKYFDDAKNKGTGIKFRLNSSDKMDVSFSKKLKQFKVEEFEVRHIDKMHLTSTAEEIQAQTDEVIVHVKDSKVQIIGLKDSVISTKKRLLLLLQNQDSKANQLPNMAKNDEFTAKKAESQERNSPDIWGNENMSRNKISNNDEIWSRKLQHNEPISSKAAQDLHSHSSLLLDKTTFPRDNKQIFSKSHNDYCVTNGRRTFRVKILKADITKLEVGCIVNAANKHLRHAGGVAKAISSAAGEVMKNECEDFIRSCSQVAVTDIFISTAGKMPAKCVMHAVGPKWDAYDDNSKPQCFDDLRHTVMRCLVEAGRQEFTSIAFPSISAAIFRVPKEACARCYMEAVKHFGTFNTEPTSLREIYFVDVDDAMVTIIQDHFEKNWTNPCNPHIVQRDCDFANTHSYSPTRNAAKNSEQSPHTSKTSSVSAKTSGANKSSYVPGNSSAGGTVSSTSDKSGEASSAYQFGKYTLCTDSRSAFDLSSDITITVGKPFDKLSGLRDFRVADNKKKQESVKNKYKLFNVSKPKSHQQKLVCALLPEPDDEKTIKQALENLKAVMQSPNHKIFAQKITKVVLTSSILYKEPFQDKKLQQNSYERKKAGNFAKCLFDFLNYASDIPSISVTVVGCEEALLAVHKVMESRGVRKISPEVQRGARSKTSGSSQHRSEGGSAQHSAHASGGSGYTRGHHGEGHQRESSVTMAGSKHYSLGPFSEPHSRYPVQGTEHHENDFGSSVDSETTTCEICFYEKLCSPVNCCGKKMCQRCQNKVVSCPFCRRFWRLLIGDQPPGTMTVHLKYIPLAGYEQSRTLEIEYDFPSGRQKDCHPHPGEFYIGIHRIAYLPATVNGYHVLKLLRLAFLRKLIFTIGRSLTMGRENSIIWNDIHHKTSLFSGGLHGYPDSNYLYNVTQELANKGVTLETVSADERRNIEHFEYKIVTSGYFTDLS